MKKNVLLSVFFTMLVSIIIAFGNSTEAFAGTNSWKVYNDTDYNITYSSRVQFADESGNYAHTCHGFYKGTLGETAKFNFTGNKLAITGLKASTYTDTVLVQIDGLNYYFSARTSGSTFTTLFSKTDLPEGEHSVIIKHIKASPNPVDWDFRIDGIQIDSDDVLLPFENNETHAILKVGKDCVVDANNEVAVNLYMDNVKNIGATTAVIRYDASKLQFISLDTAQGIRPINLIQGNGYIEIALASNTDVDYVNAKKLLATMNFKAIKNGIAVIDVVSGSITDCRTMDRSLNVAECGYAYLPINK